MNLVGSVLFGADDEVVRFVEARIHDMQVNDKRVALGVIRREKLVAGIIYQNLRSDRDNGDFDIEVAIAADDASWAFPATLRTLFWYPFGQLGLVRMTAIIGRKNMRCRKLTEGLGFKEEGCVRRGFNGRQDAMIYGLLRDDCRFLRLPNGQEATGSTAGS